MERGRSEVDGQAMTAPAHGGSRRKEENDELEQVAKRGWTTRLVPSVLEPHLGWGWAVLVLEALVIWVAWFSREPA